MSRMLCKMIFLTVAVILSLLIIPGCTSNQNEYSDVGIVIATALPSSSEESTAQEEVNFESDLISEYEIKDLEKESLYSVCDFELVQNKTVITIISCQWDATSNLRIGIKGKNGIEASFDTSRGSLSNVVPDFNYLPSGDYTLYVENIDEKGISSVSMCYSIN